MIDPIPDPKCVDLAESLLGERAPQWLCNNFARELWEFAEDWLLQHWDDIAQAKIR